MKLNNFNKNKKGLAPLVTIMIAVVVIIFAIATAPSLTEFTNSARSNFTNIGGEGLDCSNTSISDYDKATCTSVDLFAPGFLLILVGIAGVVIGAKILFK